MNRNKERLYMYELEDSFKKLLEDNKKEILESKYIDDTLHEYTDGHVPIYNYDLLRLACDDLYLGYKTEDNEQENFESAYDIIKWNIYEKLNSIAYEWWKSTWKHLDTTSKKIATSN